MVGVIALLHYGGGKNRGVGLAFFCIIYFNPMIPASCLTGLD